MPAEWNQITAGEIAQATGATLDRGKADTVFTGLSTDSRSVGNGELFIALTGDRFDGHDFVLDVVRKGARGVIVERAFFQSSGAETLKTIPGEMRYGRDTKNPDPCIIVVEDSLKALGDLAAWWRRRHHAKVIAITGSSGKTTSKEMAASVFETDNRTLKTQGNFNNLIGLPLTLLGLEKQHDTLVLEMGMNRPGEISRLTEIADPDVGVILNVGMAHLEGLHSLEGIAAAKSELMEKIRPEALMVLNGDDELLMKKAAAISRKSITFGFGDKNDVRARNIEACGINGTRFQMEYAGDSWPAELKVPGIHNVLNALAAAAVGIALGERPKKILAGLSSFKGIKGRFGIVKLKGDIFLVDDTYNANPSSLKAAIETVKTLSTEGRRLIVGLGDMLELGSAAVQSHKNAGELVAKAGTAHFFAMGEHAPEMEQGALAAGMPPERIRIVQDCREMAEKIMEKMDDRDVIFLKGSRRMGLERVSEAIKKQLRDAISR